MKYKIGDKVKIKTWEEIYKTIQIKWNSNFIEYVNKEFNILFPDRVTKIIDIKNGFYYMEDCVWDWSDSMIECLIKEEVYKPILSRYEILDIR